MSNIGYMNYIEFDKVPKEKLPIYFCNVEIIIQEVKSHKKRTYNREIEKVVLKGLNEDDLIKAFNMKHKNTLLGKVEAKYSKVIKVKIELLKSLGFGILE
jgi:hypothetical protein